MDECKVHRVKCCTDAFSNCGTKCDFIPPGYTWKLQALDVGINRPFKAFQLPTTLVSAHDLSEQESADDAVNGDDNSDPDEDDLDDEILGDIC